MKWYIESKLQIIAPYLNELVVILTITIFAVISPGPDFIVVTKNSLTFSKRSGIFTSLGIAVAIWIHNFYTLAGIGLIISKSAIIFSIVKYFGATYIIYLGYSSIKSKDKVEALEGIQSSNKLSDLKSFQSGFITNLLNPKAPLFYVSVFTQFVSSATPIGIQIIYGAIVSLTCLIWFSLISIFLNNPRIKSNFFKAQKPIEIILGIILIGFGVKMAFFEIS